jgi:multiphosphoryl transfer protein
VLLDAETGRVLIDPTPVECESLRQRLDRRAAREAADLAAASGAAISRDGVVVSVAANIGHVAEAAGAVARGADGCGLLRSEFLFMDRRTAPDEDEQAAAYAAIARAFGPRAVTLRTLDVGGDKPLAYLPLPREENPALGLRGVRVSRREPGLLRTQLRAALRASATGTLRIMLPMVNDPDELRAVRRVLQACATELGIAAPPLGAMVETPAAALQAEALLREADFLSIGSNDLSQYTLAIDRGHAELGAALDALHPAVLRLIGATASAGRRAGKRVSLCGGLAADPQALPLLLGLGLRELSVPAACLPSVKRAVRSLDLRRCETLAERALAADSAADVRAVLAAAGAEAANDASHRLTPAGEDACAD